MDHVITASGSSPKIARRHVLLGTGAVLAAAVRPDRESVV